MKRLQGKTPARSKGLGGRPSKCLFDKEFKTSRANSAGKPSSEKASKGRPSTPTNSGRNRPVGTLAGEPAGSGFRDLVTQLDGAANLARELGLPVARLLARALRQAEEQASQIALARIP